MRTRSRTFSVKAEGTMTYLDNAAGTQTTSVIVPASYGSQTTTDELHNIALLRKGGVKWDVGGPFNSVKKDYTTSGPVIRSAWYSPSLNKTQTYNGPVSVSEVLPARWLDADHLGTGSTESQLNAFGATAISRTIPTAPSADLSVLLGELLREGVPKMVGATVLKSRFKDSRDYGSEFLNVQFGWLPLVAEIQAISKAIASQEQRFAQLKRDSGKPVRRRFAWPIEQVNDSIVTSTANKPWPPLTTNHYTYGSGSTRQYALTRERWFEGCYTFNFALSSAQESRLANQAKQARILLGLDLTPSVLWNLSPWSWLADWVSNTGDVLTNVSQFNRDDLVLRYGYIMEETIRETRRSLFGLTVKSYGAQPTKIASISDVYRTTIKQRHRATPYGFGLNTSGFTPRRWAILGALGIARGPNLLS